MTCRDFIQFLDAFVNGELPAAQRAIFDTHLEICPSCVAYMNSYLKTIALGKSSFADLEQPVPDEVPEELVQAILAAREESWN